MRRHVSKTASTVEPGGVRLTAPRHRHVIRALAFAVIVAGCAGLGRGSAASSGEITLLHVNDTHSYLDAYGPKDAYLDGTLGGMAKAASVIMAERGAAPDALLLHAGDAFQGDLFFNAYFGVPELELMKQLGFDAMAVGNHELALGPDVLAAALAAADGDAGLPLLSANLDTSAYPTLQSWIRPSVLKVVQGVRIGIFGMTTPDDPLAQPAPVVVRGAGDPSTVLGIAAQAAAALRDAGADVVICLSHLGLDYDKAMAAEVPGIDVIVGGHSHDALVQPLVVVNPAGRGTLIVQAGAHYRYVGRLRFTFDGGAVHLVSYTLLDVDETVEPLSEVADVVDALKEGIEAVYGDVFRLELGRARSEIRTSVIPSARWRDSGMGDLVTDAYRFTTGTDIAIKPNGMMSAGLSAGPVVGRDLFRCLSYGYDADTGLGFKLVTFAIEGTELVRALEMTLAYADSNRDFFLEVSGIGFAYDGTRPPGGRVLPGSILVGSQPLDPDRSYTATVDEFTAALIPMLGVEVSDLQPLPVLEYSALREFVLGHPQLAFYGRGGRIQDVSLQRIQAIVRTSPRPTPPGERHPPGRPPVIP